MSPHARCICGNAKKDSFIHEKVIAPSQSPIGSRETRYFVEGGTRLRRASSNMLNKTPFTVNHNSQAGRLLDKTNCSSLKLYVWHTIGRQTALKEDSLRFSWRKHEFILFTPRSNEGKNVCCISFDLSTRST